MQQIIAIDIGTTHCKAITIDKNGKVYNTLKETYPTIQLVEGQSEQEPAVIFDKVFGLIKQSVEACAGNEIAAVSFSAAMHSIMAVDENGRPLTNAITWADTRSKAYAKKILQSEQAGDIYSKTGTPIHPMSPLSKISWIKQEMPGVFSKTHKFISIKEYIFFRLFDKYIIDYSIASATGLFDIYALQWFAPSLQIAGITESYLSQPVPGTHAETALVAQYAIALGFNNTVPFIAGGNDGCLANLGCAAIEPGEAALTIGTSGAVRMVTHTPTADKIMRSFTYLLTDKIYVTGGPTNNGGNTLQWVAENVLEAPVKTSGDFDALYKLASEAPPGAGKLIFLPYLHGERAPIWNANAKAAFVGLNNLHGRQHLTRAVIEGISFALYSILKITEETNGTASAVYVSGGFIQSKFWLQLMADMYGKKIIVSNVADASAMGAGFMAMLSLGWIKDLKEVKQFFKQDETYLPNETNFAFYQQLFGIYQSLYPTLKDAFEQLDELNSPV